MPELSITGGGGSAADPFGWGIVHTPAALSYPANTQILTANRAYFARAIGYRAITKVGIEVTNSAGNIDAGVYSGASGFSAPVTRRGSAGATACPSNGYAELSLTATVSMQAGDYLAVAADATPATLLAGGTSQTASNIAKGILYLADAHYVLPSSASGPVASRGVSYMMLGVP